MNTIELQAVNALAHIKAAVIFFVDISEQCNIPIHKQMQIYESVKPLFENKVGFMPLLSNKKCQNEIFL